MVEIWEIHARLTRAVSADLHDTTSVRPNMDGRYTARWDDGTGAHESRFLHAKLWMLDDFPPDKPQDYNPHVALVMWHVPHDNMRLWFLSNSPPRALCAAGHVRHDNMRLCFLSNSPHDTVT